MRDIRFTSDFFAGNREKLRELFTGTAPIVLTANGQLQRSVDEAYPFHQDASFWYFTGIDEPDVVLVIERDKEYLIVPTRDRVHLVLEGSIDEDALRRNSGIDLVYDEQTGWRRLGARLERAKHVATLPAPPSYIGQLGLYTNPSRRRLFSQMKAYNPVLELLDISAHIERLRSVKQPAELAAIQQAIDITAQSLRRTATAVRRGSYRAAHEIEADITRHMRRSGASGHAFTPKIAAGARACTLHDDRTQSDDPLAADELLLCDVGAEVDHYSADLSRTFALGSPSRRQQTVFNTVLEVLQFATAQLRPGVLLGEYEEAVAAFMGECLRELGLIKSIEMDVVRSYYPHLTSHFLGLAAHDVGSYDQPLEAGMVLTVEPGIYIREEALGVRLEDDILITEDGCRVLSGRLPKQLSGELLQ